MPPLWLVLKGSIDVVRRDGLKRERRSRRTMSGKSPVR